MDAASKSSDGDAHSCNAMHETNATTMKHFCPITFWLRYHLIEIQAVEKNLGSCQRGQPPLTLLVREHHRLCRYSLLKNALFSFENRAFFSKLIPTGLSNPIRILAMVPKAGLEPARYRYQRILSPSRLPFHHFGMSKSIITYFFKSASLGQRNV